MSDDVRRPGAASLLDAMLEDHAEGVTVDDRELASAGQPEALAPDARVPGPQRRAEPPVERGPRRWAADPDAQVAGMRIGGRFELFHGGPEVDGVWEVVKLVSAHPAASSAAHADTLVAARPGGGPPFVRLTAEAVAEEVEAGNLVILQADPRG